VEGRQAIASWLVGLGMSEYAERFAENDIDFTILPELSDQDLKEIGIASLGHRRKILRAIAELGNAIAVLPKAPPLPAMPAPSPIQAAEPGPKPASAESDAQRRYVTVLFCDLVGSTGIAAQLDAEEWRDLVSAYLDAASAAVAEMGGHVAKKLGDGLMALFGYPVAYENDAERAARTAMAIQRALAELNRGNGGRGRPELIARIGLDTGPAVVDATGEIYGDVANVVARVQALAEAGAVLVTSRVQRQIAGLFVAEDHGTHTLKGVLEPTALFRLVRASGGGRRSGQRNLTPLIGRDEEMTMLMRRWSRAQQGDGQFVMIVGEPGLGKSRLIQEFHARLADTPHTWVEWSCSQLLQNTPLHPIAEWGHQRFGGPEVPAERRLAELKNSLAQVRLDPAENLPLLASLIGIPLPKERTPDVPPEELRRRQLAALTNWVMAGAKAQPEVLVFEDLHWGDPTTLDVLCAIAEQGELAPLYIVATTRPEFRPPWRMRSHHSTISLAPLGRARVRDMVAEISGPHALAKDVVEDVAARTGGVPLFIEEVTRLLLERGEQSGIQAIPPTLQQSLMARLDRLGPAREVAQLGSVIGRGFSYSLLRAVAGIEDAALRAALEKLADANIVLVQGLPPDSDYRFKHALIQDAAYENLLKSRRQVLHRRVAEILRQRFADTAAAEPEVLAHHFTQAGMSDAAFEWWGKAGEQALRRSAFQEAIAHLGKALKTADSAALAAIVGPTSTSMRRRQLDLQVSLGNALIATRGYSAPETQAAFAKARELASGIENPAERFATYYGLFIGGLVRGELAVSREIAQKFLEETADQPGSGEFGIAHRIAGLAHFFAANFVDARQHFETALSAFDPERDRDFAFRFGQDPIVATKVYLGYTLWLLGDVDRGRRLVDEAVERASSTGHVQTIAYVHIQAATFEMSRRNAERARAHANRGLTLAKEHGLNLWLAYAAAERGWADYRMGDRDAGVAGLREGLAQLRAQKIRMYLPFLWSLSAEVEADLGGIDAGLSMIDAAIAEANEIGERGHDAESHRIRGEILLKRDSSNTASAEEAFLTAIAIAQQQKAKSFELRAALSLAKLYQSIGRAAEAHVVLAPALAGFSPTPEFPEIAEAQSLLVVLAC
jgi:class 3 adenylate cyclase/predicted ATPase